MRFIVPWLAAGMRSGANWAKTLSTASTTRWVVSVLPAQTAAGRWALRNEPSGMRMSTGRKVPALVGIVGSVRTFTAKNTAEWVIGATALMLPRRCGAEPAKSRVISPVTDRHFDFHRHRLVDAAVVVELVLAAVFARRQLGELLPHAALGVGEDRFEAGGEARRAVALGELLQAALADPDARRAGR